MSDIVLERPSSTERNFDRRWVAASVLLHAGFLAALLGLIAPVPPPEEQPIAVRVVLDAPGSAGAAGGGGGSGEAAAPAPSTPPAESTAASAPPQPEQSPPEPVQEAVVPPQPTPQPTMEAVQEPPPPPKPQHKPAHVARAAPEPKVAETPPPPAPPAPPVEEAAPTPAPSAAPAETASAAPGSGGGPGGKVGQGQGNEGQGFGAIGDGPREGPGDDYLAALQRWLRRYKQYPDDALKKKEEGQVMVGFVLGRDGTVLDAWIEHSSGVPALDAATLDMMHRASPVPPVPDRYTGTKLTLTMPIDYRLGTFERLFR